MVASVVANIISSTPHPMAHRTGRWNFVQGQARKDWTKSRESIFWCLFQCQNVPLMVSIFKKSLYVYIYGYIYHPYTPNVSIYTSTMNPPWDIYIYILVLNHKWSSFLITIEHPSHNSMWSILIFAASLQYFRWRHVGKWCSHHFISLNWKG